MKIKKLFDKKYWWFYLIFAIGIFLRAISLNYPLINDESGWTKWLFSSPYVLRIGHPPLSIMFFRSFLTLTGVSPLNFRLIPFIFFFVNSYLIYLLAKDLGKKVIMISLSIYAICWWGFLSSLMIDQDNTIMTALFLLSFYFYKTYIKTKKIKYLILTGIIFGISLLSKISGILIFGMIGLYTLINMRWNWDNFLKESKNLMVVGSIGALFLGIYIVILKIWWPTWIGLIFNRVPSSYSGISGFHLFYFLIWGTPLLVGLLVIGLLKHFKKLKFYISWVIITLIAFSIIGTPLIASFDRYLMIMLPALFVIGGFVIYKMQLEKKHFIFMVGVVVLYSILFVYLNTKTKYITHSFSTYFYNLIHFNWLFYLPITGGTGPAIGIDFLSLMLTMIIAMFLVLLILLTFKNKNKNLKKYLFVSFIATSLVPNFFLIEEYAFGLVHPSVKDSIDGVLNYIEINKDKMISPVYTNSDTFNHYYIESITGKDSFKRYISRDITFNDSEKLYKTLKLENASIIFLNYPFVSKTNNIWNILNKCEEVKSFYSKEIKLITVYQC